MSCQADAIPVPKPSKTNYEVIERFARHTLVKAKPRTGRLHQIRVHFSTIGHPVVGDDFYGLLGELKPERERPVPGGPPAIPISPFINRQALHAAELSFAHPMTTEWHTFTAPLPDDLENAVELVRGL